MFEARRYRYFNVWRAGSLDGKELLCAYAAR
jgi:hypothetical protein